MITKKFFLITLFATVLLSCHLINKNKLSKNQNEKRGLASRPFNNGFCNWGFMGPYYFKCQGKTYVYGSPICGEKIYENIFCEEKYSFNVQDCVADESPDTVTCYNKLIEK